MRKQFKYFLVMLCLLVTSNAYADWTNADSYGVQGGFWVLHKPTLDEPYYDVRYPSLDEGGTDDYLMHCRIFIGSDKDGYSKWTTNAESTFRNPPDGSAGTLIYYHYSYYKERYFYNEQLGYGWGTGRESYGDHYCPTLRFYPSDLWTAEDMKYMFFRMTGFWDYDDDWGDGYYFGHTADWKGDNGEDFNDKVRGDGIIFYAPANYAEIKTEELQFERHADGTISFSKSNIQSNSKWNAHIGFSFSNAAPGRFLNTGIDAGSFDVQNGESRGTFSMPEGWDPTQTYTLYYHKYYTRTQDANGKKVNQGVDGTVMEYKMLGSIYPSNLNIETDKWKEQIVLKWSVENDDARHDADGKWYIFRQGEGETGFTKLDVLVKGQTNYTDNNIEMDKRYTYCVTFVPNAFGEISEPHNSKLTAKKDGTVQREFIFSDTKAVTTTKGNGGIIVSWSTPVSNHEVKLQKYDEAGDQWKDVYVGTSNTFTDEDVVSLATYRYRVMANHWDYDFFSNEIEITYMAMSEITDVSASQGYYTNMVKVNWNVKQLGTSQTRFVVSRRLLTDQNSAYNDIYEVLGTASSYYFEDVSAQAGQYYYYKVTAYAKHPTTGDWTKGNSLETDGFNVATGIISGRVSYGSGTAVSDVVVRLTKNNEDDDTPQFFAYQSTDKGGVLSWQPREEFAKSYLKGKAFTVQCWARADKGRQISDELPVITIGSKVALVLGAADEESARPVMLVINGQAQETGLKAKDDKYYNYVLSCNGTSYQVQMTDGNLEETSKGNVPSFTTTGDAFDWQQDSELATLRIAADEQGTNAFIGNVDDIRVWNRVLTAKEVLRFYNRILSGSESGLLCYWPLDEGASGIPFAYDYSRTNGIINGNHAKLSMHALVTSAVPSPSQLSLYGITDEQGNYTIRGIPFSGEGTSFTITPVLGIHEFRPHYVSRFISNNSLTHSGVDFDDISSFPVSGKVLYEGTTIPAEGASLYVDGQLASRDGEAIMTDANGEYVIDVPIGDHYITVKCNGHEYVNEGRYPADPNGIGLRHTFEKEVSNINFTDKTLVTIGGRVAGGNVEEEKPLGVGAGKANIGQAKLKLSFVGNDRYYINAKQVTTGLSQSYDVSDVQRDFAQASDSINSQAYVEAGKNAITVFTDPVTGEWSAKVPPLKYEAESITIPSQPEIDFSKKLFSLNATRPMAVLTDSIESEQPELEGYARFSYVDAAKVTYKAPSYLEVTENKDGSFGEQKCTVDIDEDTQEDVALYDIDAEGNVTYTYGAPIYMQRSNYGYKLYAYERYANKDNADDVKYDLVPLGNTKVTVKNEFSSTTSVRINDGSVHELKSDEFELDSLGQAYYIFSAGLPNILPPYTRTLNISYDVDGTELSWEQNGKFKAIVLGGMPKGNNFVTKGPDRVEMVLRDPPGTNSSATWSKGTSISVHKERTFSRHSNSSINGTWLLGVSVTTSQGMGVAVINDLESTYNQETGFGIEYSEDHGSQSTTTITSTRDISTSDSPDYVGANGDLFIGSSTNLILGAVDYVGLKHTQDGKFELGCSDAITISESLGTTFVYSQTQIKETLIPEFEELRRKMLVCVNSPADIDNMKRRSTTPVFVTTLSPDDERFGSSNEDKEIWGDKAIDFEKVDPVDGRIVGPSYTILLPLENVSWADSVVAYTQDIENWKNVLLENEKAKVKAIRDRAANLKGNYSFDCGGGITESYECSKDTTWSDTKTYNYNFHAGGETGYTCNKFGVKVAWSEDAGMTYVNTTENTETYTEGFTYTLQEDGNNDYLSVDVLKDPLNKWSPIFYTRAGATCNPFEDEVVTEYFEPGFIIQQKTLQIEKPEMSVLDPVVTGVPAGKEAKVRILMRNLSESNSGLYYGLKVMPATNANGAQFYLDGKNIATGVELLMQGGEQFQKTLTVRQSDEDILEYKDIVLRMYSLSQPEDGTGNFPGIYSDQTVSIFYQPSCTDIDLAATTSVVNTETEDPMILSMSGYDYNQASFQEIRLQYKGENDANFKNLQVYVKDPARVAADPSLKLFTALTGTNKLTFPIDLRESDYTDQTYVFRAMTVGYRGGDEVTNLSPEVRVVRDMSRPQLIANPSPSNGVLSAGDNISLTFNEDIRKALLTKTANFVVNGVMNETQVAHEVAMDLAIGKVARTASTIDLSNRSFAVNLWLNYSHDGRILQHGTQGNSFEASIRDGKLVIAIGDKEEVSTETLPQDKWLYLAINYDNEGDSPVVSASYAQDASIVTLMSERAMPEYTGNGPVVLGGKALDARMQELTLWNEARSISDALADRSRTKNQYTNGLIGYWQMNEGHGTTATDRSRSRHLTLDSENAWWINSGENRALKLDGKTAVEALISTTANADDSYLVELWFCARKATADQPQTIISLGNRVNVGLNDKGNVTVAIDGIATTVTTTNLLDGEWHHLGMNVLKGSNGAAALYLDGTVRRQFSGQSFPGLNAANHLTLGARRVKDDGQVSYDQFLLGYIDEVRVWNGRRTSEVIKANMYQRVADDAEGLEAYYPMETRTLDEYGQIVTSPIGKEMSQDGKSGLCLTAMANGETTEAAFTTKAPSLATAPALENVQFDFVASERQITINLTEQPYKLENCNVNLTVKGIKDLNGNNSQPISWTIYVQQNQLLWAEREVSVEAKMNEAKTFTVEIENHGATADSWALSGLPAWLSAGTESGTLAPQATQKLRFTVLEGTAVGNYEETIYLTGSQNINAPLTISMKVVGEVPDWNPVPDENAMAVVGQIVVGGVMSSDPDDMIAAFRGLECVGVAQPVYSSRYDAYFVSMTVYGNEDTEGTDLTYKFYDASTGIIYPAVSASDDEVFTFESGKWVGTFTQCVTFTPELKIEQNLALNRAGWKWISMYATPNVNTVAAVFADATDKIAVVKSENSAVMPVGGTWMGSLDQLNAETMYKLQATEAFEETVIGTPVDPSKTDITLSANGWSWIGYPVSASNTLDAALADADPQEGDVLMSQSQFAMYTEGSWMGSLAAMVPGEGYKYFSNAGTVKTFHFQTPATTGRRAAMRGQQTNALWLSCEDNMAVVARVERDGRLIEDAEISVYAAGQLCGYSEAGDADGRHYLTIGDMGDTQALTLVIKAEDEVFTLRGKLTFRADEVLGSVGEPLIIELNEATGIDDVTVGKPIERIEFYSAAGVLLSIEQQPAALLRASRMQQPDVAIERVIYEDGSVTIFKVLGK